MSTDVRLTKRYKKSPLGKKNSPACTQTGSSSRQPADRGTPRSQPPHPPPHHKELEMAAWLPANLFVRELPATIRDLLPSTAAIEQQRRTRRQPSRQILFLLFAPKGLFFLPSPVSG
eukprot:scaffold22398_cov102-Isochrysis_galbana.AAC.2